MQRALHQGENQVLLARHTQTGQPAAIKLTRSQQERLRHEHELLRWLDGAGGCPRVLASGETDGAAWFAMEYIAGESILSHVRHLGRRGSPERVAWVQQAAQDVLAALRELHQRGVLHCDLKGSNVLVEPSGRVRLIDFGSARRTCSEAGTCSGARFAGTFGCAPPEQLVGALLDARTDLFAAGVLFYRLLTDNLPFWGRTLPECLRELHDERPRTPSGPPKFVSVIMESLSPKPERRPLSAEDALRRLAVPDSADA